MFHATLFLFTWFTNHFNRFTRKVAKLMYIYRDSHLFAFLGYIINMKVFGSIFEIVVVRTSPIKYTTLLALGPPCRNTEIQGACTAYHNGCRRWA